MTQPKGQDQKMKISITFILSIQYHMKMSCQYNKVGEKKRMPFNY